MNDLKKGLYIGKGEKPEDVLPPRYEVHAPMAPHPVELAIAGFCLSWLTLMGWCLFVVVLGLTYFTMAVGLVVSVIGGIRALIDPSQLASNWWIYPTYFIVGAAVAVLLDRIRRNGLNKLGAWAKKYGI